MSCACGFFVFDYTVMDTMYGRQAFEAIQEALSSSGEHARFATVTCHLKRFANLLNKDQDSPLADLDSPFDFGPYLAAMWTDTEASFGKIHRMIGWYHRLSWFKNLTMLEIIK